MLVNAQLTPAAPPAGTSTYQADQRKPSSIPEAGTDPTTDFVARLKQDCPANQVSILGQSIAKFQMHPDASLEENRGKMEYQFPMFQVITLTQNQYKAIMERAKITPIHVGPHRDFENPEKENVPEYRGFASEWLILEPADPKASFMLDMPEAEEDKAPDEMTGLNAELVKQQAEKGDEKRKKRGPS